jgi:putative tryptophan/tyrosine transport system substrate-binding protein
VSVNTVGLIITLALAILVALLATAAQPAAHVLRIGLLVLGVPSGPHVEAFRRALHDRGYVEDHTIIIEERWAEGHAERLPDLAAELVQRPVALLVAFSTPAALAAKHATSTIPIVISDVSDPVATGLVASLAQPGGNITGVAPMSREINGKRLELLKEAASALSRVAVLLNPGNPTQRLDNPVGVPFTGEVARAARALGLQLLYPLEVQTPQEIETAFAVMRQERAEALFVASDPLFFAHRAQIAALAIKSRLPTTFERREYVEAGGLMAYGAKFSELAARLATFVDKILHGAKPADLPVEQSTTFELVINLKTAEALGLTIPPTLLFQATEVIR